MKSQIYGDKYWRHDFCTNRNKIKYIECKFSNRYTIRDITGEHIVPLFSRFTCPVSTGQSGEVDSW
jgi:hypothetical protein